MAIIEKYLVGWNSLEPVILSSVATGMNLMLLGKHGAGKSSLARFISDAFSESSKAKLIIYRCDKENLISAVGIPDPTALKEGKVRYATHERSLFNADIVLLDELPRATKEGQNMFLEALEEKTIFGFPLKYKFLIATGNDETYKANFKLDAALLDRFFCVVPTPCTSNVDAGFGAEELKEMIHLNMGKRQTQIADSNKELVNTVRSIKKEYDFLWNNKEIRENIVEFSSKFFSILLMNIRELNKGAKEAIYISPRIIGFQFPRALLAISAYYKVVKNDPDYLQKGATEAIRYCLGTKLGMGVTSNDVLMKTYEGLKDLLSDISNDINRIKIEMTTGPVSSRVATFEKHPDIIKSKFEIGEVIAAIGNILQELDSSKTEDVSSLCRLYKVLKEKEINPTCLNKIRLNVLSVAIQQNKFAENASW